MDYWRKARKFGNHQRDISRSFVLSCTSCIRLTGLDFSFASSGVGLRRAVDTGEIPLEEPLATLSVREEGGHHRRLPGLFFSSRTSDLLDLGVPLRDSGGRHSSYVWDRPPCVIVGELRDTMRTLQCKFHATKQRSLGTTRSVYPGLALPSVQHWHCQSCHSNEREKSNASPVLDRRRWRWGESR